MASCQHKRWYMYTCHVQRVKQSFVMGTSMTPNSFVDFDTEISILDIGHTKLLVSVCVGLRQIKLQVTVEDGAL